MNTVELRANAAGLISQLRDQKGRPKEKPNFINGDWWVERSVKVDGENGTVAYTFGDKGNTLEKRDVCFRLSVTPTEGILFMSTNIQTLDREGKLAKASASLLFEDNETISTDSSSSARIKVCPGGAEIFLHLTNFELKVPKIEEVISLLSVGTFPGRITFNPLPLYYPSLAKKSS